MRSAAMSAWRSEKVRTRSGFSARILLMLADVKALTRGFSGEPVAGARHSRRSDDAILLAEQINRFDGLFG
jgi:hypothetical protein